MTMSHQQTSQMSQSGEHLNSNVINCCLKAGSDVNVFTAHCCLEAGCFSHACQLHQRLYLCCNLLVAFLVLNYLNDALNMCCCRWYMCCWRMEYASSSVPQRTLLLEQKYLFLLATIIVNGTSSFSSVLLRAELCKNCRKASSVMRTPVWNAVVT